MNIQESGGGIARVRISNGSVNLFGGLPCGLFGNVFLAETPGEAQKVEP